MINNLELFIKVFAVLFYIENEHGILKLFKFSIRPKEGQIRKVYYVYKWLEETGFSLLTLHPHIHYQTEVLSIVVLLEHFRVAII